MTDFHGPDLEPEDEQRLTLQLARVKGFLNDHRPHTLAEIATVCRISEASASARVRDLRKPRFGGHQVDRMRTEIRGVFLYRLVPAPVAGGDSSPEKIENTPAAGQCSDAADLNATDSWFRVSDQRNSSGRRSTRSPQPEGSR